MAARNLKSVSLTLQGMEERAVPAALANGVVAIKGTAGNDTVDVRTVTINRVDMIQVTQNGVVAAFRAGAVHLITFNGGKGDDEFEYFGSKDVIAHGGAGNDYIRTGGGNDHLYGDAGDDTLISNSGNDEVRGGSGNDWLEGGAGNDKLYGGKGDDVLQGGTGNDRIDGGAGLDVAWGGYGNDKFYNLSADAGALSAPVYSADGTAYNYGIQDLGV
jgi:Ca2+-binding RTX toxin-like protein